MLAGDDVKGVFKCRNSELKVEANVLMKNF